jgi:hypothetical protein
MKRKLKSIGKSGRRFHTFMVVLNVPFSKNQTNFKENELLEFLHSNEFPTQRRLEECLLNLMIDTRDMEQHV